MGIIKEIVVVIPSLNPDESLVTYLKGLIETGFSKIIVVDDGSKKECQRYFDYICTLPEIKVLRHAVNQGKGRALKTAYHYYLNHYQASCIGVVTADADGQHSPKDTYRVAQALMNNRSSLILGTRNFDEEIVPFKSKFGNKITSTLYHILFGGTKIHDTQTGLRGLPNSKIMEDLQLEGERFEYEINVLIHATEKKMPIKEIEIETIYENGNRETHFDALRDSIRIYKVMFRKFFSFMISGLLSSVIDIALFTIFVNVLMRYLPTGSAILVGTVLARICSSLFNYQVNKTIVFKTGENGKITLIKYYILCVCQMMLSAGATTLLYSALSFINVSIIKVMVDLVLFCISFKIQNKFIFKK